MEIILNTEQKFTADAFGIRVAGAEYIVMEDSDGVRILRQKLETLHIQPVSSNAVLLMSHALGDGKPETSAHRPKFKAGDRIINTRDPQMTYDILDVVDEKQYKVKIISRGRRACTLGSVHLIKCERMDEWGEVLHYKEVLSSKKKK